MQIWIDNSELSMYDLTADPRFFFKEGTDFGMTTRTAEEIVNPLTDVDSQRSDNWGKLREITLMMRIRGDDMDDLMANAEWLQEQFMLDEEWWLVVKPTVSMPNSYFRILKSPLFAIPLTRGAQMRSRVDVEVRLNAEPFIYGAVRNVLTNYSMPNPGSVEIDEAYGDFDAPLYTHVECAGAEQSWFGLSDIPYAQLQRKLTDFPYKRWETISALNMIGDSTFRGLDNDQPLDWGWVRIVRDSMPPAGSYRVLVRFKDNRRDGKFIRAKFAVTDWYHDTNYSRGVRPSTYKEFKIIGASRESDWLWLDLGEFRAAGKRYCVIWGALAQSHRIDAIVFLPTDHGMLGLYQYNHVYNRSPNERPTDFSWNQFTYDRPDLHIDSLDTTSACCGTGLLLPAGTGTKHFVCVVTRDSLTPSVTLTYRPRYSGWARE